MATETVHFANIHTKPVYEGKFRDWSPSITAAGKLTAIGGETVYDCLKPKNRPPSPEVIRRFRRTFRPDAGKRTIFYGKAYDPHLAWAEEMRHGLNKLPSIPAGKLVNPHPKTLFQQKRIDRKEKHYASHVRAPLGTSHDQTPGLPAGLDPKTYTFGVPFELDEGVGALVNPKKTYAQVDAEAAVGHDDYIVTHKDYRPSEHVNRHYTTMFKPDKRFGAPTYCDVSGKQTKKSLRWPCEIEKERATKIVSKRLDDFQEKFQPTIGHFRDPIKETMRVGPDFTFGQPLKPDGYGVRELLHDRLPKTYAEGKDLQRGLITAMRQHLKDLNFHCFPELIHAFRFYDKEGKGKIDKDDVREACTSFNLPVDVWLLEQVLDYCDEERDGQIDYRQFANFLDWKERLPPGFAYVPCDMKKFLKDRGPEPATSVSSSAGTARLQRDIDRAISDHHTTAEMINAAVGPTGMDTTGFRSYGIPTIRTDVTPPTIRRVDDRQNYGDESTAYGLTNPSIYSHHGVYEKHLLIPRTRQELKEIYNNVGIEMNDDTFDIIYGRVSSEHPRGHVSVESFRNALDDLQRAQIAAGEHPLAF